MIICSISNLSKEFGADKIFENVTFDIKAKERVGLIGRNGTGKTTILKILDGRESYNGQVHIKKGVNLEYLEQIPEYPHDYTALDVMYLAFEKLFELQQRMKNAEEAMNKHPENIEKTLEQYGKLQSEYELMDGYNVDEKISKITIGLGIDSYMQKKPFNILSGGEKTKVILGKILLSEPDILLLDEPSNHLDLNSIEWLEGYLLSCESSVLIVSHDRYFLDKVAQKIVEIDFEGAEIYNGNFSYYQVEKERRFIEKMNFYQQQQKKIKKMEEQIHRYRVWGAMRDSDKMYRKAKEMEKRLEKVDRLDKPILEKRGIRLNSNDTNRTGNEVLTLDNLSFGYDENMLFKNIEKVFFYQDRVGILGGNGTGKTTLLKIVMDKLNPITGTVKIGSKANIGYLSQEVSFDDESLTIIETFQKRFIVNSNQARNQLAKVLFIRDDVFKQVRILSGGEKSRLTLAMLLYAKVNVLILDEPTNHLDISSREVLEQTLKDFEGTIIFVSHDRYFINQIAEKVCELTNRSLECYDGDYEYYKREKQRLAENILQPKKQVVKKADNIKDNNTVNNKVEKAENPIIVLQRKQDLESIEIEIEQIESRIDDIDKQMITYGADVEKLNDLQKEKDELDIRLNVLLDRWGDICK